MPCLNSMEASPRSQPHLALCTDGGQLMLDLPYDVRHIGGASGAACAHPANRIWSLSGPFGTFKVLLLMHHGLTICVCKVWQCDEAGACTVGQAPSRSRSQHVVVREALRQAQGNRVCSWWCAVATAGTWSMMVPHFTALVTASVGMDMGASRHSWQSHVTGRLHYSCNSCNSHLAAMAESHVPPSCTAQCRACQPVGALKSGQVISL